MRPSQDAIVTLDKSTKPRINHIIAELIKDDLLVSENIRQIDGLFAFENVSLSDMARGIYNPKSCRGCGRNRSMAMILANGEIHPCNAVEYFHEPIVGNVRDMSLIEAWHAAKWQDVRHNGLRVCNMCPMPRHVSIRFTQEAVSPFYSVPGDEQTSGTSIYD
jgi:radical SAM protein with 4Fe4S-binding SPASM domain